MHETPWERLTPELEDLGAKYGVIDLIHLPEIKRQMEETLHSGHINDNLFTEYLSGFKYSSPADLPDARTAIVVSYRHPQHLVRFSTDEGEISLTIPPTYIRYRKREGKIAETISHVLCSEGFRAVPMSEAPLPLKILAVRSGLGEYGRNNICYVPGFGSFHRLVGFYTDLPTESDSWRDPKMMEDCLTCGICGRACPTGAIPDDGFLLRSERCLTFHSERVNPLPSWVDPSWFKCLVGCMICQVSCPVNMDLLGFSEEALSFSPEETDLLLNGKTYEQLPETTRRRIDEADMTWLMDVLPRNLRVQCNNIGKPQ